MMDSKRPPSLISRQQSASLPQLQGKKQGIRPSINFSATLEDPNSGVREQMHELKLKSAIARQEFAKSQRENSQLQEELKKLDAETKRLEKTLTSDERYLQRQEEELSVLRAAIVPDPAELAQRIEAQTQDIESAKDCLSQLKRIQDREIAISMEISNDEKRIKELLAENSIPEALALMKRQISLCEEQLVCKDTATRLVEQRYLQHLELIEKEKRDLQAELDLVKTERVSDQRELYTLERRVAYLESDAKLTTVSEEAKITEKVAIQAAEQVLGKLKEKLRATDEEQPFLETITRQVNKNKSRIINLF